MNTTLQILQGVRQIGGNIILIEGEKSRLILDFGIPLTELDGNPTDLKLSDEKVEKYLPYIPDLYRSKQEKETLIFVSHAHPDHFGLLSYVDKSIPIYTLDITKELIEKGSKLLYDNFFDDLNLVEIKGAIHTPDFIIDGFLVDHSVAGSCAFKITDKKSGKNILYSGDLRTHGRSNTETELFVKYNTDPDYLILEGTTLSRVEKATEACAKKIQKHYDGDAGKLSNAKRRSEAFAKSSQEQKKTKTEEDIENEMTEIFSDKKMSIVCCSPLNIDRIVSVYNACKRADKTFVIDPYTAYILETFRDKNNSNHIPYYKSENIKVYCVPNPQSKKVFEDTDYMKFRYNKIDFDDIMAKPEKFVIKDNDRIAKSILKRMKIEDINLVYSYWDGYLENKNYRWHCYKDKLKHVHTSGHIAKTDLINLVRDLRPKKVIPVHTLANDEFKELFKSRVIELDKNCILEI